MKTCWIRQQFGWTLSIWPQLTLFECWIALSSRQIAIQWRRVNKTNHTVHWIEIYPMDRVIDLSNNLGLNYTAIWMLTQQLRHWIPAYTTEHIYLLITCDEAVKLQSNTSHELLNCWARHTVQTKLLLNFKQNKDWVLKFQRKLQCLAPGQTKVTQLASTWTFVTRSKV